MSDSVRPHRWEPTWLLCSWDSPGKNSGVGCHFLLQCMKVRSESKVAQLCPTFSDPMDCSLPGSSVHGIFQARVLEWVAIEPLGKPYFFYMGLLLNYLIQFLYSLLKPLRKPDFCPEILQVKKFTLIVFPISSHA